MDYHSSPSDQSDSSSFFVRCESTRLYNPRARAPDHSTQRAKPQFFFDLALHLELVSPILGGRRSDNIEKDWTNFQRRKKSEKRL